MSIDQAYLSEIGVKSKVINTLLGIYKGTELPAPPIQLKDYEIEGEYYGVNEFYALKILMAQRANPSATAVHKFLGGKTGRVFKVVRTVKEMALDELELPPVDPTEDVMEGLKRELIKAKAAEFKAELDEQERYAAEQLSDQAAQYEERIRQLEGRLNVEVGKTGALTGLAEERLKQIDGLHLQLRETAVNEVELRNAQFKNQELCEEVGQLKDMLAKQQANHEHYAKASSERHQDLKDQLENEQSRNKETERDLRSVRSVLEQRLEENDALVNSNSQLRNEVEQQALQLDHEHDQQQKFERFMSQVTEAISPMQDMPRLLEDAKELSKTKAINIESIHTGLNDLSTKLLNLPNEIIKGMRGSEE